MHGQYNARPMVTFPAIERHRLLAGTSLYTAWWQRNVCEQSAQSY